MEYGFNLVLKRQDIPVSQDVLQRHKGSVAQKVHRLELFIMKDGASISAELIAKELFPQMSCDVFISHSSDDQDIAIQLAHELEQRGIRAFVDSVFWGSAYKLLKAIDDKHSKPLGSSNYNYERCNRSAAHVHMILVTALQNMIMRSGALLFLNTDRSISTKEFVRGESMTHSPWIHMELMFSHMLWKLRRRKIVLDAAMESFGSAASVIHTAPVEHLKEISSSAFMQWLKPRPRCDCDPEFYVAIRQLHTNLNRGK